MRKASKAFQQDALWANKAGFSYSFLTRSL